MQPIVQKEFYLAKAAGLYAGEVPDPVSTTDYYYAALCGKYVGELPEPVTAEQKYLANLLGKDVAVPEPITLDDIFMYDAVMRIVEEEPITRKQYYWRLIAKSRQYVKKTASGNPITLTDSAENKPLGMTLYGWSKQDGTPSPENPVEIESAGMKWSTGKNLFDERLLDDESNYNKQYQSSGYWILAIPVKNGLVTVSVKNTTNWGGYLCVNSTGIVGDVGGIWMAHGSVSHLKRTATLTITHGFVYLLMSKGVDTNKRTLEEVGYIQVEYGTEATSYEPYTGGVPKPYGDKVELSVRGKNLFHITKESDCDKAYDNTTKRIILPGEYLIGLSSNNYYIARDASIDLNTDSISFIYSGNSGYGVGVGINCQKNKTYAFSFETNKGVAYAVFYSKDGKYNARVLVSKYNVFAVPDYAAYVVIVLTNNNSVVSGNTIWFKNIQIEETKSITAYEPYRTPQYTAIVTPNGLPGIPVPSNTAGITYTDANGQAWIADEIDLERGKYVQRVWQAEFDGSKDEAWGIDGKNDRVYIKCFTEKINNRVKLSNMFNDKDIIVGFADTYISIFNSGYYDVSLSDYGLANWKAHLSANPLVVMTYLDTPIERDLTSAELAEYTQLYSYKPTTIIENDSGCWMDVTALCKPE